MMEMENSVQEAIMAPVPSNTETYVAVPNKTIIEFLRDQINAKGFKIRSESVKMNAPRQIFFGNVNVASEDEDYSMNIGWINSYNKSRRFGIAVGLNVHRCSNLDYSGLKLMRKHTTNVYDDLFKHIESAVNNVEEGYNQIVREYESLKSHKLYQRQIPKIIGDLFWTHNIITSSQLNILKSNMKMKEDFGLDTFYDVHMHLTNALKTSHPSEMIEKHVQAREYMLSEIDYKQPVELW